MKGIATVNFKGGVGKTTISWILAKYAAEKRDKKVLVIDTDAQMSLTLAVSLQESGAISENLELLGKELDIDMEFVEKEHSVGNFHLDILAREINSDRPIKALYEVLLGWGYWEVEGNDLFEELGIETLEERIGAIIMAKMPGTYLGWIDPEHNSIWHSPGPAHSLCFSIKKENSTWIIFQGSDSNHYDLAGAGQTLEDCVAIDEFATFKRQNGNFVFDDLSLELEWIWIANQLKNLSGNTFNCIANDLEKKLRHISK
jgi:hypothetical protein